MQIISLQLSEQYNMAKLIRNMGKSSNYFIQFII